MATAYIYGAHSTSDFVDVSNIFSYKASKLYSTDFTVTNGSSTLTVSGSSFSLDGAGKVNGVVTGVTSVTNKNPDFTVFGFSLNVQDIKNLAGSSDPLAISKSILSGDDKIYYGDSGAYLNGYGGNDYFDISVGSANVDGGDGIDTVHLWEFKDYLNLTKTADGYTITPKGTGANKSYGVISLENVERIQFNGMTLALDIQGNAGQVFRLYQAALNRLPDNSGLQYWIKQRDSGVTLKDIALSMEKSAEYQSNYGGSLSADAFVDALYINALHRSPDKAGHDYWVSQINSGFTSRENLIIDFSESAENKTALAGVVENGFYYGI